MLDIWKLSHENRKTEHKVRVQSRSFSLKHRNEVWDRELPEGFLSCWTWYCVNAGRASFKGVVCCVCRQKNCWDFSQNKQVYVNSLYILYMFLLHVVGLVTKLYSVGNARLFLEKSLLHSDKTVLANAFGPGHLRNRSLRRCWVISWSEFFLLLAYSILFLLIYTTFPRLEERSLRKTSWSKMLELDFWQELAAVAISQPGFSSLAAH